MNKNAVTFLALVSLLTIMGCNRSGNASRSAERQATMMANSGLMTKNDALKFLTLEKRAANGGIITEEDVFWAASLARNRNTISNDQDAVLFMSVGGVLSDAVKMPYALKSEYLRIGDLMVKYKKSSSAVPLVGIQVLAKTGDLSVADKIRPFLSDSDPFIRKMAAKALEKLGTQ